VAAGRRHVRGGAPDDRSLMSVNSNVRVITDAPAESLEWARFASGQRRTRFDALTARQPAT
jgi:hypothetical protein